MTTPTTPVTIVIDTNIWLDLLVFHDPHVARLAAALADARVQAVASPPMLDELTAVLGYSHLRIRAPDPEVILRRVRACTRLIPAPGKSPMAQCTDPDDQKFLEAAAASGAVLVVSKDKAVLKLARKIRQFAIVAPGPRLDAALDALASPAVPEPQV